MKISIVTLLFVLLTTTLVTAQNKQVYTEQQARKQIEILYKQLQKGANFEELAQSYSQDITSGSKGGDLGWTRLGTLVDNYEKAVRKLKVNQFTKPFQTEFGYHIAQLVNKKGELIRTRHILIRPAGN